jgi:eukaryotic-like serine/threonine-protein kinase
MGDASAKEGRGSIDPMIGRIIDGRYRIHSLLAIGGMGRIYKAEQSDLDRTVAIKILAVDPARQEHDPHFRQRFALEAAMASRLTSPNTITIFHYGRTDDGVYYIIMEYVEGVNLGRFLKRERRLPVTKAVTIASQVCLSLREAHGRGIIHRDIKPTNVMLVNGEYDQVKLLDFGIAKQTVREPEEAGQELTASRSLVGTPEYMAPECFDGKWDARSDIYSVGVMLYLALSGYLPFKGKTATQTILLAVREPPPPFDPALDVPRALEELIFCCLEKDPERRPASADELLHALQLVLAEAESGAHERQAIEEIDPDEVEETAPAEENPATHLFVGTGPSMKVEIEQPRGKFTMLAGAAALFAIGASVALLVRLWQGDDGPPSAPAAERPARVQAAAKPVPPPPKVTPFAATPADASDDSPADGETDSAKEAQSRPDRAAAPRAAPESEKAAEVRSERRRRSSGRSRSKPAAAPRREPDRSGSDDAPAEPKEPVPDGYKPSPY